MKLDKEDKFYEIKLQTLKADILSSLEPAEKVNQNNKKNKKRKTSIDYAKRKNEALANQRVKRLIDLDEEYSSSIKSIAIEKSSKIYLTTRFLNGKMIMFCKVSIKSFVFDLIDVFMFPNAKIQEIYEKKNYEKKKFMKVNRCYLDQNLTDTDTIQTIRKTKG